MIKPVITGTEVDLDGKPFKFNFRERPLFNKNGDYGTVVAEIHDDEVLDIFIHPAEGTVGTVMNIAIKASTLINIIKQRNNIVEEEGVIQVGEGSKDEELVILVTEDELLGR